MSVLKSTNFPVSVIPVFYQQVAQKKPHLVTCYFSGHFRLFFSLSGAGFSHTEKPVGLWSLIHSDLTNNECWNTGQGCDVRLLWMRVNQKAAGGNDEIPSSASLISLAWWWWLTSEQMMICCIRSHALLILWPSLWG